MKFSHKFLITNFLILVFVIIANILALKYFSSIYFNDYVLDIKEKQDNNVNVDFDLLSNILNTDILDENVINEYKKIIKDLLAISNSLEKFSQKPVASKTSLVESLKKVGIPLSSFEQTISTNAIQSFFSNMFDFVSLDLDAPE
jgi:molecular chaperone GrpE (heat shock protein)